MTLDEIESYVKRYLGDLAETGNFFTDADIANWVYEAELKIARIVDIFEDVKTTDDSVADQADYAAPADKLSMQRVEFDGNFILQVEFEEIPSVDSRGTSASSVGIPSYWYFRNDKIWFYPAPDSIKDIHIWYRKYPTKLTVGSNSPTVPVQYHTLITDYCVARGKGMEEESQDMILFDQKFDLDLANVQFEVQHGHEADYPSVRAMPGDTDMYGW